MGWGSGTNHRGREVGYNIEAICDRPGCTEQIDRGVASACGGMHDGGDHGCGRYFCGEHLAYMPYLSFAYIYGTLCDDCLDRWMDVIGIPGFYVDLDHPERMVMHRTHPVNAGEDDELLAGPPACGADVALLIHTGEADLTMFYPWCIACWQVDTVKELIDEAQAESRESFIDGLYAAAGIETVGR